jgi:hypothetical protein
MKETNSSLEANEAGTHGNAAIDQGTQDVLDDYSRKLLGLIQLEKEKIRKQATVESEKLIFEAERKARLAYEKAIKNAESETSAITASCTELVATLSEEADHLNKTMLSLKEKTERQISELNEQLQHETDTLADFIKKSEKSLSDIQIRLDSEFTDSNVLINDIKKRLQQIKVPQTVKEEIPLESSSQVNQSNRDDKNTRVARKEERSPTKPSDKTFVGTLNLEVHRGSLALSRRFKEALSKVPGLEISMTDEAAKDKLKIVAFVGKPIPLMNILQQMSLVKSVTVEDDYVEVILQDTDRWVG